MAILTKAQLQTANSASFPDNNSQAITPQILRTFNSDVIDTLVDSLDTGSYAFQGVTNQFTQPNNFTSISASSFVSASQFIGDGSKITGLTSSISLPILDEGIPQGNATSMNFTGSAISATIVGGTAVVQVNIDNVGLVTTASFNAYTQSTNASITNLNASSASQQVSIDALNQSSASQQVSINALNVFTASQDSSSIVNSITELNSWSASAKIELTNLNTSVTNLNSFSSSTNSSITQLNASSASQQVSINALNTNSASVNTSISALNSSSASQQVSINNLNTTTASLLIETQNLELFSASALTSISNLNASSASQQVSINSLNSATSSYVTETESGSFLLTASFDNGTRNLTFTKGNNTTFAVNIPDVSGSAGDFVTTASFNSYTQSNDQRVSSLESATSSYVTESETASFARTNVDNNFTANQTFTNITAVSASFTYVQTTYETASVIYSSGSNQFGDELSDIQTLSGSVKVQGSLTVNGTPVLTSSVDISGLTTTASFNAYTQSNDQKVNNLINATASYATSAITASSLITASAVGNTITFTKGDASTFNVSVSSTPIDTGSFATTASFNSYTSSNDQRVSSLETNSASVNISISNLNTATASLFTSASLALVTASASGNTITFTKGNASTFSVSVDTGSAATTIFEVVYTGENITKGDPLYISGSQGANPRVFKADAADPLKMPVTFVSNETIGAANTTNAIVLGLIEGIDLTGYVAGQSIYVAEGGGWSANLPSGSNSVTQLLGVVTKGGSGGKGLVLNPGPAQLPGLDTGKMWVGNGNNQPIEITTASFVSSASFNSYTASNDQKVNSLIAATGSYATTGSNSFVGNQTITGSLILSSSAAVELTVIGNMVVTGSAFGNVVSMSITSNTASMDLSRGNYFTLTLADTATTHISASNVQPGVSATLVITTGTNSSASLAPTMLQPSGSAYSATLGSAKRDVLSIVAVASGVPYVVSTKNMI